MAIGAHSYKHIRTEDAWNNYVRSRWDPWDSYDRFDKDGGRIRRNGGGLSKKQRAKTLQKLIDDGVLFKLPRATESSTDIVYFIQRESGGAVKIGHTTMRSLSQRLMTFQTAHEESLVVRGLLQGGAWLEAALHELFESDRRNGEWYKVSPLMQQVCPEVVADGA